MKRRLRCCRIASVVAWESIGGDSGVDLEEVVQIGLMKEIPLNKQIASWHEDVDSNEETLGRVWIRHRDFERWLSRRLIELEIVELS